MIYKFKSVVKILQYLFSSPKLQLEVMTLTCREGMDGWAHGLTEAHVRAWAMKSRPLQLAHTGQLVPHCIGILG